MLHPISLLLLFVAKRLQTKQKWPENWAHIFHAQLSQFRLSDSYFKIHIMREKQSLLAVRFRNDFATKSRVFIGFNAKTTIISSNKMKTNLRHLMKKCIVIGGSNYLHTLYFCPVILHFQTCA